MLFNDRIITKSQYVQLQDKNETTLKLLLTTLEYCEVFIEITAAKLWGNTGRWFFIFVVQVIKYVDWFFRNIIIIMTRFYFKMYRANVTSVQAQAINITKSTDRAD